MTILSAPQSAGSQFPKVLVKVHSFLSIPSIRLHRDRRPQPRHRHRVDSIISKSDGFSEKAAPAAKPPGASASQVRGGVLGRRERLLCLISVFVRRRFLSLSSDSVGGATGLLQHAVKGRAPLPLLSRPPRSSGCRLLVFVVLARDWQRRSWTGGCATRPAQHQAPPRPPAAPSARVREHASHVSRQRAHAGRGRGQRHRHK
jgi:hypothetical protein